MDEDDGTALIQGTENTVEHRTSQVSALLAGEKNNTVCMELIDRVVHFSDGRRGIGDWHAGKKPNRPGWSATIFAAYSFVIRASRGDGRITSPDIRG